MKEYKGNIKKKITIKLIGDAEKAFKELNRIVGEQRSNGIANLYRFMKSVDKEIKEGKRNFSFNWKKRD